MQVRVLTTVESVQKVPNGRRDGYLLLTPVGKLNREHVTDEMNCLRLIEARRERNGRWDLDHERYLRPPESPSPAAPRPPFQKLCQVLQASRRPSCLDHHLDIPSADHQSGNQESLLPGQSGMKAPQG